MRVRKFPYTSGMKSFQAISKLTSKNQTTLPLEVRKALGAAEGDRLVYRVLESGVVELTKEASVEADDRVVASYLEFLERDMVSRPSKLSPLVRHPESEKLLAGVEIEDWATGSEQE